MLPAIFIRPLVFLTGLVLLSPGARSQDRTKYSLRTLAFYNLENLFDTHNDSLTFDDARTPGGNYRWTSERYREKIKHISAVLSEIGSAVTSATPDLIGLCEVENRQVLDDLIQQPKLIGSDYGIIHFDSPDERGIDVALLYKRAVFTPLAFNSRRLLLYDEDGMRDYTRDPLVVTGLLDGEELHLIVNHWPSRSGGQARSDPYRKAAAELNRQILDSLSAEYSRPAVVLMGDLNDNPTDSSLKKVLKTKSDPFSLAEGEWYNPMESLYRKGAGTLAYRDIWSLFDQILLTAPLLDGTQGNYHFWRVGIHHPPELSVQKGRYKGYPLRTYSGGRYSGGYSDHFPVYLYLIRSSSTGLLRKD